MPGCLDAWMPGCLGPCGTGGWGLWIPGCRPWTIVEQPIFCLMDLALVGVGTIALPPPALSRPLRPPALAKRHRMMPYTGRHAMSPPRRLMTHDS